MTEAQFISRFLEGLAAPLRSQAVERPTGKIVTIHSAHLESRTALPIT
jgi:hypothetical protein